MTEDAELKALYAVSTLASSTDDPGAATREILATAARAFSADSGIVAFQNPETGKLEIEASLGLPQDADLSFAPGQGVPGWVAWHAKPVLVPDSGADLRSRSGRKET